VGILASESPAAVSGKFSVIAASQRIAAFAHKNIVSVANGLDIDSSAIECLAPCTPAQEGMIYRFLDSDKALYFARFDFSLRTAVDQERLREGWLRVARKVQILRTKFAMVSDGCAQVVLRDSELLWSSATITDEELQESLIKQSLDISRTDKASALANPYRVFILRSETRQVMSLHIFHGLYDAIGLSKILRKVREEYNNMHTDYGPDFHVALPYGPLSTTEGAEELWRLALKGVRYNPFPRLKGHPYTSTRSTTVTVSKTITSESIAYLASVRRMLSVTHLAILQAAWSVVLQDLLSSDVAFGLVVSGRSIDFPDAENIIGPMLNTLPFRVSIAQGVTWRDFIRACHEWNVIAMPYQHTPLKEIQKWCGEGKALFDTLFAFQWEAEGNSSMEDFWEELPAKVIADVSPTAFKFSATLRLTTALVSARF
jgi:ferricrocin synthase